MRKRTRAYVAVTINVNSMQHVQTFPNGIQGVTRKGANKQHDGGCMPCRQRFMFTRGFDALFNKSLAKYFLIIVWAFFFTDRHSCSLQAYFQATIRRQCHLFFYVCIIQSSRCLWIRIIRNFVYAKYCPLNITSLISI